MERAVFRRVVGQEAIERLARLADEIWHECFPGIISQGQIDYMVARFQSADAMMAQIAHDSYEYYTMQLGERTIGYIGIRPEASRLFLSKLYLHRSCRGCGYASEAFRFLARLCRERKLTAVYLTVNRYNRQAIAVYEKCGFRTIRAEKTDIGNGYCMDDYVMEWPITGEDASGDRFVQAKSIN